jgi:hypothetical protein
MTPQQALTQLQRAVIQRLRDAGYITVADCALDAWSHGKQCTLPNVISTRDAELRAEYERANA